ncbi:amino acid permease [Pedobacter rhizosphaerae]|uniref:Amino acid/polyamine/organocation transporter, APC superfamily n=1 Tax=Pedobacter rhizosphaerae TaxID=390241 RepID=A0A1H9NFS3_9SPHI|nr:amino acid permease [Pedobacter rhizosphaerae]SER34637.1 amino acid/polyamine/organocation transporter, APC superfamily [Pedobacter rhizosphaerae]
MNLKKPIDVLIAESAESGEGTLKRTLSSTSLVALGIGAIIGAGLFSLTGIAAADHAGPAVTLSFVLAAVGCAFAGLCYAEFASMIPVAGSAYTYSYATMGEFMAWIIGWDLVLEYALGAATVGVSWSGYFNKLLHEFGVEMPLYLTKSFAEVDGGGINLPAVVIVSLLSLMLIRGTKESASLNNILVIVKVAVVILFISLGWKFINPANHTPYIPQNTGVYGEFGISGIAAGAALVFFAFIGFDAVSTAAQEAKNPQKGMPIGILGSLVICTILYVLFAHVMTGLVPFNVFKGDASPAATAFKVTGYNFLQLGLIIAILAGYTSVILVMLMGQSRVFYTMSKDGLLPKFFSSIHTTFRTPFKTNLFFMVFVSIFAGFVPVTDLGHMVSIGTLFAFSLVCIGVMLLRKTDPDRPRPFKTPLVPFVPIMGIVVCVYLMYSLPFEAWIRLAIWMGLGIAIYFFYGKGNSVLRNKGKVVPPVDPPKPEL